MHCGRIYNLSEHIDVFFIVCPLGHGWVFLLNNYSWAEQLMSKTICMSFSEVTDCQNLGLLFCKSAHLWMTHHIHTQAFRLSFWTTGTNQQLKHRPWHIIATFVPVYRYKCNQMKSNLSIFSNSAILKATSKMYYWRRYRKQANEMCHFGIINKIILVKTHDLLPCCVDWVCPFLTWPSWHYRLHHTQVS